MISEEKLNKAFDEIISEQLDDDSITVESLSYVVGHKLDDDYVYDNDKLLSKNFSGYVSLYGFSSFSDLYLYAKSQEHIEKTASKNKDTSKLQLVQRTVVRRGKPTTLSFYQDPNKGKKVNNLDSSPSDDSPEEEQDLNLYRYLAGDTFGNPKLDLIAKANSPENWYTPRKYSSKLYDYTFYVRNNVLTGVTGVSKNKDTISLVYCTAPTEEDYREILYRGLQDMVKESYDNDLGFSFEPKFTDEDTIASSIFDFYGVKLRNHAYTINPKDMKKIFGERLWER